jgi:two-component system cell cycle response regulator DivK
MGVKIMTKVLVVEDNPLNMELVLEILNGMNFQAHYAVDGKEAVKMAQKETYDLILMDIDLPDMNGVEVARIIRTNPTYMNTPIIALTAYVMKGDRERFLASGFSDYVPKPVDVKEFMKLLDKYKK